MLSTSYVLMSLVCVAITVLIYALARFLQHTANNSAILNPLVLSAFIICAILLTFDIDVAMYRHYVSALDLMLGPATVALAVPLYKQAPIIFAMGWRVVLPIIIAGVLAPAMAWAIAFALDAPLDLQMTLMVKSITTPLAMQTSSIIGGIPDLSAVVVILTGMTGALISPILFVVLKSRSDFAKGVTLGSVSHVIGTTQAFSINQRCGAFATLSLCINGVFTALFLPLLII